MPAYDIIFKPSVEKDLRSLPKSVIDRVLKQINSLTLDPLPRQTIKLTGAEHLYRIRVGDYRVVYEVNTKEKRITIHHIRHRRDIYR